jgi:RimJ/RimL family protein N-acetyltransferase
MNLTKQLFEAEHICLAAIDMEKDVGIEARWTQDAHYLRMLHKDPALPLSPEMVKKRYEAIEKEMEENKNLYYFTIRMRPDDRLIGFARIYHIIWTMGYGLVQLGIGEASERRKGYGSQALRLLVNFAFSELNLYNLGADVPEYNPAAARLLAKAGFVEEARLRQALYRDGRRWDMVFYGLLVDEWRSKHG